MKEDRALFLISISDFKFESITCSASAGQRLMRIVVVAKLNYLRCYGIILVLMGFLVIVFLLLG